MNRNRVFKWLRIAFSATCLVACVLLIALWVRSYWSLDSIETKFGILGSVYGKLVAYTEIYLPPTDTRAWRFQSTTTEHNVRARDPSFLGFYCHSDKSKLTIFVPYWFLLSLTAFVTVIPWVPWSGRFSLRTLLIAMTLVAVALGLFVWLP